jgi:uncharacterized protein
MRSPVPMRRVVAGVAWLALLATACSAPKTAGRLPAGTLHLSGEDGDLILRVEIADTEAAREVGLMGRKHLAADAGMAFLFDGPTLQSFWMKDTLLHLSIAFWGPGGGIVDMLDMAPCRTSVCPLYQPRREYVGAVEANRGAFARAGIRTGDRVILTRSS